jgi:hypothetical protein
MSAVPSNIQPFPNNLDDLVADLVRCKQVEEQAKRERMQAEERILALVPAKEEGATTVEAGGLKVTLTGKLSYKADDLDAVREVTRKWDANLVPIKTTHELDATGCKFLRAERPELWAQLARVVTTSPAKTSVTLKV